MKQSTYIGILTLILAISAFSCKENTLERQRQDELEKLADFIDIHYPNVVKKSSGLYYIETHKGTGDTIKTGDKVQIFYSTWTVDSLFLDQTTGYDLGHRFEPFEFVVGAGDAISGLEEGMTFMQPGTRANLVIPSELAYGQNGSTGVGGFTTLLMEVEVYKVYPIEVISQN